MTFGSLFSGIGGMDLGLERSGMQCRWQVEIDPWCRRVLTKHWPQVPKFGDIKEITGKELEPVDLIAGGFPCQPVSLAGKGKAQEDDRWLWPEFARILRVLRPPFALLENVPGLLVRGFGDVLGDLAEMGYAAGWGVLSACRFGAPHMRKRLFVVAHSPRIRRHWGTLPEPPAELLEGEGQGCGGLRTWPEASRTVGVAYGVPRGMDRIRGLGNAVVPQVAEWIGRRIVDYARCPDGLRSRRDEPLPLPAV